MSSHLAYVGKELDLFAYAKNWKRYCRSRIRSYIGGEVLEVGAGGGETTRVLRKVPHRRWTCLEPDARLAAGHRKNLKRTGSASEVELLVGTTADLSVERSFDTIVYIDVLEHIADDRQELVRAANHLRPGGFLVVLSPAHQWLFSPFDTAIGHFRRYDRRSLRAVGPSELTLVKLEYLDSMGLVASAANRALLRSAMPTLGQIRTWDGLFVPISRISDALTRYRLGKSLLGIWRRCDVSCSEPVACLGPGRH